MATKSSINPISGLASLEPTAVEKVDPTIQALATDKGSTSTDILANMQKRAAELTSPWHAFQTGLDSMVARTHYDPTQAIASMDQRKANEAAELQNIGTTKAQVDLLRSQLGNMNTSFNQISGKGGVPTTAGGAPTTKGGAVVNVNGVDIPFTPDELRVAEGYKLANNPAGYQAYLEKRANIYTKANAEAKNAQDLERLKKDLGFQGIGGMDTVETVLPLMLDGKPVRESVLLTKDELRLIGQNILPKRLADMGYSFMPIQKKAAGGVIRQNYLADGQQPTPVDPLGNVTSSIPSQDYNPSMLENVTSSIPSQDYNPNMLENVVGAITGSGNAQAKEPSVTLGPPTVGYGLNPKALERQQQGQIESGLSKQKHEQDIIQERNKAELESEKEERKKAGDYIADISTQSAKHNNALTRSEEILKIASEHPEDLGYEFKQDPMGLLLKLAGSSVEKGDASKERQTGTLMGLREFVAGEPAMERRSRLDALARQLGIDFEKEEFGGTGSKMGAQLTSISQSAKGLGSKYPASQNIEQALAIKNTAEKNVRLADEWDKYKTDEIKAGRNPDAFSFMKLPKTKSIEKEFDLKLKFEHDKLNAGVPPNGTQDKDIHGNPIVWMDGKPKKVKQ